jgi:hypothetical protein
VAASCGHFSFSLQAFANEMQTYLSILEELKEETEKPIRSWKWLKFWKKTKPNSRQTATVSPEEEALINPTRELEAPKNPTDTVFQRHETRKWRTSQSPKVSKRGFYEGILHVIRVLGRDDGELRIIIA